MKAIALAAILSSVSTLAFAGPEIGAPAPAFEGVTSTGETISLDQFEGQNVVLEWTNHDCPFVKKHYETGNMQATQTAVNDQDGVWISIISSAPGKQGNVSADEANGLTESREAKPDYVILDESGAIGRAYAAKTTPHMFVINGDGALKYDGAIDDKPSANHATVEGAENYLLAAFTNVLAGNEVETAQTKPYGCSVKYGS